MLTHANVVATVETAHNAIPPQEHRLVSLLPLSHLMEQAIALFYALTVGADILYVRSRNPRVIFEAIRDHHVTTMLVVPQILDLFWSAIGREVEKSGRAGLFERLRADRPPASLPCPASPLPERPRPARRRAQPVRLRGGVPAAGAPAGSGRTSASSSCRATAPPSADRPARPRARTTGWAPSDGRSHRSRSGSPRTARSSSADPPSSRATGATRPPRPRRSPPTAGTGRATSLGTTMRATSS